jgi:hypothetical protein
MDKSKTRGLEEWNKMPSAKRERLIRLHTEAAQFLIRRIREDAWQWSDNYLREHVRVSSGETFTNTVSPYIYAECELRNACNGDFKRFRQAAALR